MGETVKVVLVGLALGAGTFFIVDRASKGEFDFSVDESGEVGTDPGDTAPAVAGRTLNGGQFDLSEYRGEVVVLDFWATWCPPCRGLMPHMKRTYDKYGRRPLQVVGVNLDRSASTALKYVNKHGYRWPNISGGHAIAQQWDVTGIPTLVVIDANGVVRYNGSADLSAVDPLIEKLVKEAESAPAA